VKLKGEELLEKAEKAIRTCLDGVPFIRINEIRRNTGPSYLQPDLWIKLGVSYGEQDLLVEVKSSGEPRFAREAAGQLLKYRYSAPPGAYGILVAPFISPRGAEICAEEKIGHVDLSGNCLLSFGQIYIERKGEPNRFSEKRDLRSLYSPKAERVLRVLLVNPHGFWKLQKLAEEAEVSIGQVSKVKKILSDQEWIEPEHGRIQLIKPLQLLSEWAENYDPKRNIVRDYYTLKKTREFEADLAEVCGQKGIEYALTGFSAAARLAAAVRYQRAMAYVNLPLEDLSSSLELKEVTSGANVSLIRPYDAGVFYGARTFDEAWIASPVQVYLDLIGIKGRGEEAAQVILDEVIRPLW
jgi:hypothetical protein